MTLSATRQAELKPASDVPRPRHRTTDIAILVVVLALVALSAPLHGRIAEWVQAVQPALMQHPIGGPALFVLLAALSAMLMFFSSLVLIPVGVVAWGQFACFVLLWSGWFLGGVLTYSIGRFLGRPVVDRLVSPTQIAQYEARVPGGGSFGTALLIQMSIPTDIAGYFFGLVKYRTGPFLAALALAELPYALGTVYVGKAFVDRQYVALGVIAVVAITAVAVVTFRRSRSARA